MLHVGRYAFALQMRGHAAGMQWCCRCAVTLQMRGHAAGVQWCRYLQFGLGLSLVNTELSEWLLQRLSLSPVELSLLLQDFSHLLIVLQPDTRARTHTQNQYRSQEIDNTSSETNSLTTNKPPRWFSVDVKHRVASRGRHSRCADVL